MTMYRECFQHLGSIERKRIVTPPNVVLRLNRGERPDPLPPTLRNAVGVAMAAQLSKLQQYPSYPEFYQKLAKHVGVPVEQIVVGAGIEEFIRTLMFMCCNPGERAAVLWPTCAMYDIYAQAFAVDLVRIKPTPGEQLPVHEVFSTVKATGAKVLFLPNPGQPVETYYAPQELDWLASALLRIGVLLVVDEAHYGFGARSALPVAAVYRNVLVMRTFSKFYGAASIRVGYVVGAPSLIKPIDALRPSGEIAGPSMAVASALLDRHEDFVDYAKEVVRSRDYVVQQVRGMGLRAYGQHGFSVLIEFPSPGVANRVGEALASEGVYVKTGFPPPVASGMLVACGLFSTMKDFLQKLERWWSEVCVG